MTLKDLEQIALEVPSGTEIFAECLRILELLLMKNRAYGDSALRPLRIISKLDAVEQIRVRIDDKLSRLQRGAAAGEDVTFDLIGYLVLLRIAERHVRLAEPKADLGDAAAVSLPEPDHRNGGGGQVRGSMYLVD